jgi:RNA polymerase sigma factor (sigma-70 family)
MKALLNSICFLFRKNLLCLYLVRIRNYTEIELVESLKLRDENAYSYLYDHYSKALFTIIYQVVPQQESAEDILQQVFLKIWKNIESYDASKGRIYTWMINLARNQALDHIRSKDFNRQNKTSGLTENVYKDEVAAGGIRDSGLNKVLEQLPEENRKLLEFSYFQGYTQAEIAEMMNIPLGTVKTRLRTTIIQLRKILEIKPS